MNPGKKNALGLVGAAVPATVAPSVYSPKLSTQWFLKMEQLSKPALDAVMDDTIEFVPEKFKNTYRHWMDYVS